jgi:hypothetical protein
VGSLESTPSVSPRSTPQDGRTDDFRSFTGQRLRLSASVLGMESSESGASGATRVTVLAPEPGDPTARSAAWSGLVAVLAGLLALACLSVGPMTEIGLHLRGGSVYTAAQGLLAAARVVVGAVAVVAARTTSSVALAAAAVFAAQLAAAGVVAYRHWVPWSGMGPAIRDPSLLKGIGIVLAVASLIAVMASALGLIARGAFAPRVTRPMIRVATVAIGLVTVGLIPLALAGGQSDRLDWESQGAFCLLYAVPWGVAIAVSAWLFRPAALGLHAAVVISAVVASQTTGMMSMSDQSLGFGFAALAALSAAVTRYSDQAK